MEDFKKLNERVEKILEQVNVTSMVNIGKNIFDTFMKRDILYSPDIQEQDKVSWYSDYKGITFLINIVKGDGTKKGQFVKKNNEMSLFVPPSYWKKYINKPFLNIAKNYLQDNYNSCRSTFNHEITHFEKILNNDSSSWGYKRAKRKSHTAYMKHPAELEPQIVGALSNVDNFLELEDINVQKQILANDKNFYNYIRQLLKYRPEDMTHFNQFRKFKPNVLDKLISKIKPLGKLLNTDSYAMNVFNQAIKDYRVSKLKELY